MKKAALATVLFVCSGLTHAQPHITGMWQAEVQPGVFWTIELKADGSRLTGTVHDRVDAVDFYDGTISGNSIAFKVTALFGEPTITFTGVVTDDQIAFAREIQGQGAPRPFPGIASRGGVRQFTVTRVPDGMPPKRARGTPFPQQLTVYDRRGKIVQTLGTPDVYNWPVFSPDGNRLAFGHRGHLWVFDLAGDRRTRVTSPPWLTFAPAWSADGRQLTYFSWRERSAGGVYQRASDGTGSEEKLYESQDRASVIIRDLSADERWLSFDSGNVMFTLPLTSERKAIQLAPGDFRMRRARFSPDNRFLAYESDETGQFEVFVQSFDPASGSFMPSGRKWQISKGGGGMAHWRRDGRELIYLGADGAVRAVDVSTTPVFSAGTPRVLFQAPDTLPPLAQCFCVGEKSLGAVSRDGQRVAFAVPLAPQRKEITVAPEILSRYTGTYQLFGFDVKIALEDNRLVATGLDSIAGALVVRERARLVPQSETSYFFKESSGEIDFGNDENGKVAYFLLYEGFGPPTKAPRK
jgi:WD40-like Beta Propeller Repeat